jgi:hypothetical protein
MLPLAAASVNRPFSLFAHFLFPAPPPRRAICGNFVSHVSWPRRHLAPNSAAAPAIPSSPTAPVWGHSRPGAQEERPGPRIRVKALRISSAHLPAEARHKGAFDVEGPAARVASSTAGSSFDAGGQSVPFDIRRNPLLHSGAAIQLLLARPSAGKAGEADRAGAVDGGFHAAENGALDRASGDDLAPALAPVRRLRRLALVPRALHRSLKIAPATRPPRTLMSRPRGLYNNRATSASFPGSARTTPKPSH